MLLFQDFEELLTGADDAPVTGTLRLGQYLATGGGADVAIAECAAEGEEEFDKPFTVLMAGDTDNIVENRKSVCKLVLEAVECVVGTAAEL